MKRRRQIALAAITAIVILTAAQASAKLTPCGINVADYGAVPNDSKDDTAAVNKAVRACEKADTKELFFPGGTFDLADIVFPPNISVVMVNGALLNVKEGAAVIFNGPFSAGLYQVFSADGKISFGNAAVAEVYPQWWGTGGDDDSIAIKKAVDSAAPGLWGITVKLVGTFNCKSTVRINRHRAHIWGGGMYSTQINFNPPADTPLFEIKMDEDAVAYQCSIKDLALLGQGPHQKVGIKLVDTSITEVRNIAIKDWTGGGSIGLQIQGREMGFIENVCISADLPISIEKNPNITWIGIDHFTFRNTYLLVRDDNGPSVKIGSGVVLSNVVFEGTNAWVKGKYGLYWDDAATSSGFDLSIKNVRMEGGTAPGGHIIHINQSSLSNLIIENIYGCRGGVGGFYLRGCGNVTIQNVFFTSTYTPLPAALDIDESCSNVALINCYWNAGTVSTGKLVKVFGASHQTFGHSRLIEVYDVSDGRTGSDGMVQYGTRTWSYSGTLAGKGDITLGLPIGYGMGTDVATVIISATDGADINESGLFMSGANAKIVLVAGTSLMRDAAAGGSLCVVAGNRVRVINYTGVDLDIVVTIFWKPSG